MPQLTLVLVHGGQHTRACWDPTVAALLAMAPDVKVLPVNLPGHGDEPGDLATLTIAQCVDSVVAQTLAAKPERVILVGHSMAGITLPGVALKLGPALVRRLIFVACCVPPNGKTVLDTLQQPMAYLGKRAARRAPISSPLPPLIARWAFANGMTRSQQQHLLRSMCPESATITTEPVDRSGLPPIPRDWILTLRDRAVRPGLQRRFIENLGGVENVVEIDACHDVMISHPEALARTLLTMVSQWVMSLCPDAQGCANVSTLATKQ